MRKITINITAEDFSGVKLEANGSMMASDKDYQYFLEEPGDMIFHYSQTKAIVNKICKDAFAKVGIAIDDAEDLKKIEKRFYSEDGKEQSYSMVEFLRPKEERGHYSSDNSHDRTIQNELYKLINEKEDKLEQEIAQNK